LTQQKIKKITKIIISKIMTLIIQGFVAFLTAITELTKVATIVLYTNVHNPVVTIKEQMIYLHIVLTINALSLIAIMGVA